MAGPSLAMSSPRSTRAALAVAWSVVWLAWLAGMAAGGRWELFADNWFMSVTMAFGSFIAGATSEGGGAVAFPVMTLGFGIEPAVARDFSLMIQAVGMTAAGFTILWTRIEVERHALLWSTLGGAVGIVLGLEFVAPRMPPAYAKMLFTSTWLAFAFALYWINRYHDREVHHQVPRFGRRHALMLLLTGVVGGAITSVTGSGLDIATFALLVLRMRVSESVATPTSVVLMGINAALGALYRGGVQHALAPEAWSYWWVCVPIVVVGAPFGARFIEGRSRLFVAAILYASIVVQSIAALVIVPQTPALLAFSGAVFLTGLVFFRQQANRGVRRLQWLAELRDRG
jgi:uncharacterized membrane protein YfcA